MFYKTRFFSLLFVSAIGLIAFGCGAEGTTCPCGTYKNECVPCDDDIERVILDGDAGIELNQDLIDTENGYFLNQEGDGRITVYAGQQTPVGVRVVTYYGRPAPDIPVTFQINEVGQRPSGAQLSALTANSNQLGRAAIQVIAPPTPGFLD